MGRGAKTTALVLRARPYREYDRMVVALTPDHGKIDLLVAGARKTRSRLRALVLPFTESELWIVPVRAKSYWVLTGGRTIGTYIGPDESGEPEVLGIACQVLELSDRFLLHGDPAPVAYALCRAGISAVGHAARAGSRESVRTMAAAFTLKLLAHTGFRVPLWNCVRCGGDRQIAGFDPSSGGAICEPCFGETDDAGRRLLAELRRLEQSRFSELLARPAAVHGERAAAVVRGIAENVLEAPLRTQRYLSAISA